MAHWVMGYAAQPVSAMCLGHGPLLSEPPPGGGGGMHLTGKGPQRRPQRRLGRRLEEVAEAVGGGYCRLQMPLNLHLPSGRQRLGVCWTPWRGGGRPFQCIPPPGGGGGLFGTLASPG